MLLQLTQNCGLKIAKNQRENKQYASLFGH